MLEGDFDILSSLKVTRSISQPLHALWALPLSPTHSKNGSFTAMFSFSRRREGGAGAGAHYLHRYFAFSAQGLMPILRWQKYIKHNAQRPPIRAEYTDSLVRTRVSTHVACLDGEIPVLIPTAAAP
jgi:hypothetical protein